MANVICPSIFQKPKHVTKKLTTDVIITSEVFYKPIKNILSTCSLNDLVKIIIVLLACYFFRFLSMK